MIRQLQIQNFQSHESTSLEFSERTNVILGPSDSGKSAIIRAIRWLIWNRPSGEAFRSSWGGKTEVCIELSGEGLLNSYVERARGKQLNLYTLTKDYGAEPLIFDAIRTDVPEEVTHLLNLNEINIQQQLDRPFLLDASPGEVAQHFNKVAHLDVIDIGLKRVQQWVRNLELRVTSSVQYIEELEGDLTQYSHLGEIEGWIVTLEGLESKKIQLANSIRGLRQTIEEITETERQIKQHENVLSAEEAVSEILGLLERRSEKEDRTVAFAELLEQIENTDNALKEAQDNLKNLTAKFEEVFPDVCPLCGQETDR